MVSLLSFILSSSSFPCSESTSTSKNRSSRIKSKFESKITRRTYTTYTTHNTSREQLLIPSDCQVDPIQNYQEPRRSSLGQHWYHSKSTRAEVDRTKREFGDYYLLAVASRPAQYQPTQRSSRVKQKSVAMPSNAPSPGDGNGNINNIFGETFESTTTDIQDERRRSYGIGGAGNIRE